MKETDLFLLPAKEVWGKIIFLHLSVILFTRGVPAPRGVPAAGGCLVWGGCSWGVPGGDIPQMATAVGGTHPTGMHSCHQKLYKNTSITNFVYYGKSRMVQLF